MHVDYYIPAMNNKPQMRTITQKLE